MKPIIYLYVDLHSLNLINPIQDGHFWGCSGMGGGQKGPSSLKFVTHILQ